MPLKNHINVGSKLLQTNKKWSQLKQSQKDWIYEVANTEFLSFKQKYGKLPFKKDKDIIIDAVYDKIQEHEIWIPYYECKKAIDAFLNRQNRKEHNLPESKIIATKN